MTTEIQKSSLVVTKSCLLSAKRLPEHSEMIINTNCLIDLMSSDLGELVVSSLKIPAHLELTNHDEYERGVQETAFTTGEMLIGSSPRL